MSYEVGAYNTLFDNFHDFDKYRFWEMHLKTKPIHSIDTTFDIK